MQISNRTPHPINIDGETYPPTGEPIRLVEETVEVAAMPWPAIEVRGWTQESVLAAAEAILEDSGDLVLVPRMVLDALAVRLQERALRKGVAPDTGPESVIRDEDGRIVGVSRVVVRRS